jgi:hypothetical protein
MNNFCPRCPKELGDWYGCDGINYYGRVINVDTFKYEDIKEPCRCMCHKVAKLMRPEHDRVHYDKT